MQSRPCTGTETLRAPRHDLNTHSGAVRCVGGLGTIVSFTQPLLPMTWPEGSPIPSTHSKIPILASLMNHDSGRHVWVR